jgi:nicotinamidase-related amidase
MRILLFILAAVIGGAANLHLRSRVEAFRGSGDWQEVNVSTSLEPRKTAIIICDMWDRHWCRGATGRVDALARKAAPLLTRARSRGVLIVHAPSDTMEFYRDAPQRLAIRSLPKVTPPSPLDLQSPKLPIDDSDGGCDTPGDTSHRAWTRQIPLIEIAPQDLISDNGEEIYTALKTRGITTILMMGVHTNMCVLNRSFAIKQMTRWGMRAILIRDLTDAMYDPKDAPYVSHDAGTELVIQYIEKYWCPTILSSDLLKALAAGS